MIQGFFKTIQNDYALLSAKMSDKLAHNEEQTKKVNLAATRFFSTLGMALGVVFAVKALPFYAVTVVGAVLTLALAAAIFTVSRDVFVIAKNESEQSENVVNRAVAVAGSFIGDVTDFFKGRKNLNDAPRHHCTEGTLLRPLWDMFLAQQA